jgi:hypothetical protein
MNNVSQKSKTAARGFAAPAAPKMSTWENAWEVAEGERSVMVAEFHAWLVKTRVETERLFINADASQREIAPFAQAGLDLAATPADVPLCVLDFAARTLAAMELRRKLDLLNVYYRQALGGSPILVMEKGNEAEVNQLWSMFIEERDGAYE